MSRSTLARRPIRPDPGRPDAACGAPVPARAGIAYDAHMHEHVLGVDPIRENQVAGPDVVQFVGHLCDGRTQRVRVEHTKSIGPYMAMQMNSRSTGCAHRTRHARQ